MELHCLARDPSRQHLTTPHSRYLLFVLYFSSSERVKFIAVVICEIWFWTLGSIDRSHLARSGANTVAFHGVHAQKVPTSRCITTSPKVTIITDLLFYSPVTSSPCSTSSCAAKLRSPGVELAYVLPKSSHPDSPSFPKRHIIHVAVCSCEFHWLCKVTCVKCMIKAYM